MQVFKFQTAHEADRPMLAYNRDRSVEVFIEDPHRGEIADLLGMGLVLGKAYAECELLPGGELVFSTGEALEDQGW